MIFNQQETYYEDSNNHQHAISQRSGSVNVQLFKQMAGGTQGTIVTSGLTSLSKSSMTVVATGLAPTTTPAQLLMMSCKGGVNENENSVSIQGDDDNDEDVSSVQKLSASVGSCRMDTT